MNDLNNGTAIDIQNRLHFHQPIGTGSLRRHGNKQDTQIAHLRDLRWTESPVRECRQNGMVYEIFFKHGHGLFTLFAPFRLL